MRTTLLVLFLALCCAPLTASAESGVYHLERVGTREAPLLVAATAHGVVFISPDHEVYRGFRHERTARTGVDQPWLWVTDVDNDRNNEIIGAGRPSFVIDHDAQPLWGLTVGCEQFWVGRFTRDPRQELFCRRGDNIELYAIDGTRIFVWEGRGFRAGSCYIDDFNSNGMLNVACQLPGDNHLFFDFTGEPDERTGPAPDTMARSGSVDPSTNQAIITGERPVRVGRTPHTLRFEDGTLRWSTSDGASGSVALPTPSIHSAAGANLGSGDRLYIGGTSEVFVVDVASSELVATIPADPRQLTREPQVRVRTATGNRLVDATRETIGGIIGEALPDITRCYADRMGQNQYTRTGELIFQLTIDGQGRVSQARRQHTTLRNAELESCIEQVLRRQSFPEASEGEGIVMTAFEFDFVDRPR